MIIPETGMHLVTPEIAAEWLTVNYDGQRKVGQSDVLTLARIIKRGDWVGDNGQTITFSSDNYLVNGQHRLHAVIEAGVPVDMFVVHSSRTAAEIMGTIDVGRKRSTAQFYYGPNSTCVTALAKRLICLERGSCGVFSSYQSNLTISASTRTTPGTVEVLDYIDDHENELQETYRFAARISSTVSKSVLPVNVVAYCCGLIRFCGLDESLDDFAEDFTSEYPSSTTLRTYRRVLVNSALDKKSYTNQWHIETFLYVYDKYRTGVEIKGINHKGDTMRRWGEYLENARFIGSGDAL